MESSTPENNKQGLLSKELQQIYSNAITEFTQQDPSLYRDLSATIKRAYADWMKEIFTCTNMTDLSAKKENGSEYSKVKDAYTIVNGSRILIRYFLINLDNSLITRLGKFEQTLGYGDYENGGDEEEEEEEEDNDNDEDEDEDEEAKKEIIEVTYAGKNYVGNMQLEKQLKIAFFILTNDDNLRLRLRLKIPIKDWNDAISTPNKSWFSFGDTQPSIDIGKLNKENIEFGLVVPMSLPPEYALVDDKSYGIDYYCPEDSVTLFLEKKTWTKSSDYVTLVNMQF